MLAIDLFKFLDRLLWVLLFVQKIEALVVKAIGRLIRSGVFLFGEKIETAAGANATRDHDSRRDACDPCPPPRPIWRGHGVSGSDPGHELIHAKLASPKVPPQKASRASDNRKQPISPCD